METLQHAGWASLRPSLGTDERAPRVFARHARRLARSIATDDRDALDRVLGDSLAQTKRLEQPSAVRAALHVLTDLARQGWAIRVTSAGVVDVRRPPGLLLEPNLEKARIREQELLKRDEQLREPSVRRFVHRMERRVVHRDRPVSVLSLLRDGRELADALRRARELPCDQMADEIQRVIDPYIQFVDENAVCQHTGLALQDIWRYFRHTWSNQYTSTPGRWLAFLVRDRATDYHPVVGIGAIGSPIIQIRERDDWIGWNAESFLKSVSETDNPKFLAWLDRILDDAVDAIFVEDFLAEALIELPDLTDPSMDVIRGLKEFGEEQRRKHHRFVQQRDHKASPGGVSVDWRVRAKTHLFRSKRALTLADMLLARRTLQSFRMSHPLDDRLRALIESSSGRRAMKTILRKAKADRVGIAMADITVCGAIEPYRGLLGGKLVSMLAASPEVVVAYRNRYREQESEIASSMAGRPISRSAHLVLLGTTSLYGVGSSQYNRLKMPTGVVGGCRDEYLEFHQLGKSEAYGTSQFSSATIESLVTLVQQTSNGQRVNSIFGEGVSPKLRKVREGLSLLSLPENVLLQHGRRRIAYGVPLARNFRSYLLGLDQEPLYLMDLARPKECTVAIVNWWKNRWLSKRIMNDKVLARLDEEVLIHPIRHRARVVLPTIEMQYDLDVDT